MGHTADLIRGKKIGSLQRACALPFNVVTAQAVLFFNYKQYFTLTRIDIDRDTVVLLGRDPTDLVNRGTGLDDDALRKKIKVVVRALEVNAPDPEDPLDVLAKVGGYEIGGIP